MMQEGRSTRGPHNRGKEALLGRRGVRTGTSKGQVKSYPQEEKVNKVEGKKREKYPKTGQEQERVRVRAENTHTGGGLETDTRGAHEQSGSGCVGDMKGTTQDWATNPG